MQAAFPMLNCQTQSGVQTGQRQCHHFNSLQKVDSHQGRNLTQWRNAGRPSLNFAQARLASQLGGSSTDIVSRQLVPSPDGFQSRLLHSRHGASQLGDQLLKKGGGERKRSLLSATASGGTYSEPLDNTSPEPPLAGSHRPLGTPPQTEPTSSHRDPLASGPPKAHLREKQEALNIPAKLLPHIRRQWRLIARAWCCTLVSLAALLLVIPRIGRLSSLLSNGDLPGVVRLAGVTMGLIVLRCAAQYGQASGVIIPLWTALFERSSSSVFGQR